METIDFINGKYEGSGQWYDSAGKTMAYRVAQANRVNADGFEIEFKHDFDDGSITDSRFVMTWIAPFIFRVDLAGKEMGRGYCIAESCHFHIRAGESYVEVSYRPTPEGLVVNGSATKNSEGNFIAWRETLRRLT